MIQLAAANSTSGNIRFLVGSAWLEAESETFDLILDRHAPFDLYAIAAHLKPVGYFVTQQVGERNMACVQAALDRRERTRRSSGRCSRPAGCGCWLSWSTTSNMSSAISNLCSSGSVVWTAHADLDGSAALSSATALNRVLAGNVDERGLVTNEHRYLAVATTSTHGNRSNRLVPGASVGHNP
jgi:hypothetical protein